MGGTSLTKQPPAVMAGGLSASTAAQRRLRRNTRNVTPRITSTATHKAITIPAPIVVPTSAAAWQVWVVSVPQWVACDPEWIPTTKHTMKMA